MFLEQAQSASYSLSNLTGDCVRFLKVFIGQENLALFPFGHFDAKIQLSEVVNIQHSRFIGQNRTKRNALLFYKSRFGFIMYSSVPNNRTCTLITLQDFSVKNGLIFLKNIFIKV